MIISFNGANINVTDEGKQKEIIAIIFGQKAATPPPVARKAGKMRRIKQNKRWSQTDDSLLIQGLGKGMSYEELSFNLGRSMPSLHTRASYLRHHSKTQEALPIQPQPSLTA